jgi:hypothetical protein
MSVNPFDLKTVLLAKHAQHVVLIHFPIALFGLSAEQKRAGFILPCVSTFHDFITIKA